MIGTAYGMLMRFCSMLRHPLLLVIRIYWGYLFFTAGLGKLEDLTRVAAYFNSLEIPFPLITAYAIGIIECFGGLLLLCGFLSRLVSVPLVCVMLGAYFTAHYDALVKLISEPSVFVAQEPFPFLLAALLVLIFGPGLISIDGVLAKLRGKKI